MSKNKVDMRKVVDLHLWAAKVWWKIEPKLFITTGLYAVVTALIPYITVWFSARIINELAGLRRESELWKLVIATILITAVLKLISEGLFHWKNAVHGLEWDLEDKLLADKINDMDFPAVESPETLELRFSMRKQQMGNVYGFMKIHNWYFERVIGGIASILGAVTLTYSLFLQRVPAERAEWLFLNSPWLSLAVILVLLTGTVLAPIFSGKAAVSYNKIWKNSNVYYRSLNTFGTLGSPRHRSVDVRMYNQQEIAKEMVEKSFYYHPKSPSCKVIYGECGPLHVASAVVSTLLIGVVYVFVCMKAWAGAFGIGSVTQYVGAVTKLCSGVSELFSAIGDMPNNANYLRIIKQYMEIPNEMYQGSLPTEKRDDREYHVEFRDVSFKYPGSEAYALHHVNMKFRVGSRLAVVGMNGSGKTTFIKLLCRLYDPTEGQILLNGIDIRKYDYKDYMDIFAAVFQDFQLTALPLGENVATSKEYDRERAEDCLRKVGFGDRLASLSQGLDTYLYKSLDKDGVDISGGEAQKIAIARALYKDAPFIILDEPTASLDPMAEAEVYSKFNEIAGDKTAIYISHRLSSCVFCDEIAVFHEGAVVQQGTHGELVRDLTGKYYELWNAQAQYYA